MTCRSDTNEGSQTLRLALSPLTEGLTLRSDLPSPPPSPANEPPRPHERLGPRVVLIGGTDSASVPSEQQPASVFPSEQAPAGVFPSELPQTGVAPVKRTLHDSRNPLPAEPLVREAPAVPPPADPPFSGGKVPLALLALIVLAQAGFIVFLLMSAPTTPAPETGSVIVTSVPLASPVSIDGISRGTTPFTMSLPPGPHRIDVGAGSQIRTQTVTVTAGSDASLHIEFSPP